MVRMIADTHVPPTPDTRLDELAELLARGVLRIEANQSGFDTEEGLDLSVKTRLSVTTSAPGPNGQSPGSTDIEVT